MADNKLRFDIEANSDAARRALADLRREFDATLGALKKQQGDVALFKAAQQDAAKLEAQIKKLAKAGKPTGDLEASLTAQRSAIAQQGAALKAAGVDTGALASAQSRLRTEVEQATRTYRQQAAAVTAAADAAVAAAAATSAAEQKQVATAAQRASALEAERQARIAYGNQVLASLRDQAAAQEQAAAIEKRARADATAAARADAANARVRAAQQQQAARDAQNAIRLQSATGTQVNEQERIANIGKVVNLLRAQSAALEQTAVAERRAAADAAANARAAAANARVRAAAQQQAAQAAQNAMRVEAAARVQAERGQVAVAQSRQLAAAQAQTFANAQRVAAATNAQTAAISASGSAAAGARAQIAGYAAALLSVGAAVKGINAITSAGTQLQALNSTLLFATGSADEAASAYAFVRAEAERLGLPINVLGKQFAQLAAAANGTALQGDETRKIFTSVASAARVMGLQSFQVERALLAVQQIMSKGNVQAEELRGQLGEQIPGAFNIAARAMGVTTAELNKMLKAGEVLSEDFLPKFAAELQRTVDPAVPAAVKTYAAEIERLKNTFTIFLQEVGKSGALEAISAQVVIVTQKLQEMSASGELKPAIEQLVGALSLLATGLAELAEFVAKNAQTLMTLAAAFAVFNAAQIGLGLANTVAEFGKLNVAAGAASVNVGKLSAALKGFVAIAVIGFTVDQLVQLVQAIKEANAAEDKLATDRGVRNAEADIAIIQNADYARAVTKTAAEVKAASDKERTAYAASLKAAIAYWKGVQQVADRNTGVNDPVPQAALDAARQARIYRQALAEFDAISDDRLKLEAKQAAEIRRIKDAETATIEFAVEAQIAAVKKARDALRDSEKELAAIAKRTLEFQQQLAGAGAGDKGFDGLVDVGGAVSKVRQLLAGGDATGALDQIEVARKGMLELVKSGKETPYYLQSFARELGVLAQQAGEATRTAAEDNVQEQERKLLTLQSLARELETLAIDADVSAAEKAMQDLHARSQAFYDANPLIVKVVEQRSDDIALGIEKAPKRAGGGPIYGAGTGTSDSILARLSHGEYVVRAAAVKKLGLARLNAINRGRLPGFADGGLIAGAVGGLPRAGVSGGGASTILNLTLPGVGSFETRASEAVAAELERALRGAALKHGRRT